MPLNVTIASYGQVALVLGLDLARVHEIANRYLAKNSARPQFFNSLTVVLRPKGGIGTHHCPLSLSEPHYNHSIPLGPIRIRFDEYASPEKRWPNVLESGHICWNRKEVHAVAIDGQHRLAAIKELHAARKSDGDNSTVSVLLLIIDERVGFLGAGSQSTMDVMRSLFIDLNKHAVPVSRARNLLLDDRDPVARFVRSLLSESLAFEAHSAPSQNLFDAQIPCGTKGEFESCLPP